MIPHALNLRLVAFWLFLVALVLSTYGPETAFAQSGDDAATPSVPTELTKEQVDDMVARLSDAEVRQLLIQQLEKVASPEEKPVERRAVIDRFVNALGVAETNIEAVIRGMSEIPGLPVELWKRVSEESTSSTWSILFKLILFFAIGLIVEQVFRRLVIKIGKPDTPNERLLFSVRFKLSFVRAVLDVLAIIVFTLGTVVAWLIFELPTENADFLFTTILSATIVWRLVATGLRLVLAPKLSWLRLVNLNDVQARRVYTRLLVLTGLVVYLMETVREVLMSFGFTIPVRGAVGLITSAIFMGTIVFYIWQARSTQDGTSVGDESKDYLSRNWHVLAIIGVLFIYAFALGVNFATGTKVLNQAIASLVLLGFIPVLDIGMRGWVSRFMGATGEVGNTPDTAEKAEGETETSPMVENMIAEQPPSETVQQKLPEKEQSYEGVIITNLRILLFLFSVIIFAEIWDLNLFGFLEAMVGERAASVLVNFSITALLAYALWGVVSTAVARIAGPEPQQAGLPGDEGGGGSGSRLGTVLPLFRKFLFITLMVMLIMILLSSLGVDIGPLIAGAGILGIAIGFGAQTLIKDIVSGVFFLLDDAFRVGEYVTIGGTKGTVEKISVRSLRLRHHNGPLHTVPFGEIQTLTNWSRDWAIMKFEIRVPFETDVDVVRRIIKKVGIAMMEDEELGPLMLEPLKSQGVNRMDDSSFIIRCKFTSIPGQQFYIRREAYARIQAAFEEKGIKFAPRRVIVETTGPATPAAAAAAAGAAAGALDADAKQDQGKDEPG